MKFAYFLQNFYFALILASPESEYGWTKIYYDLSDHSWAYFSFSILLFFVWQEWWFFAIHKWLFHSKFMFRSIHYIHHMFPDPNPEVRVAAHWIENLIMFVVWLSAALVFPMHPIALIIARDFIAYWGNLLNHLGYEFFPSGFTKHWLTRHITTSTHHSLHHSAPNSKACNFSLIINFDILFGSQHPQYDEIFEEIKTRGVSNQRSPVKKKYGT